MSGTLSQRQFAALVGATRQQVARAVAAGAIAANPDKSIAVDGAREGFAAWLLANPPQVAVEVAPVEEAPVAPVPAPPALPSSPLKSPAPPPPAAVPSLPPAARVPSPSLPPAPERRRPTRADAAKLAEDEKRSKAAIVDLRREQLDLEVRQQRGELVEVAAVVADSRAAGQAIREHLLAIPSRIALQLEASFASDVGAARAVAIELVVADEINRVLTLINETRFVPPATT